MVKIPLVEACRSGNKAIVKCIVDHGVDVNKINNNDGENTPL